MASPAITVSANDHGDDGERVGESDRPHDQDRRPPESPARSVRELEAAISSLEERLAATIVDLTYQIDTVERHGDQATHKLALEVAEMGEALARRIRAQPARAANASARQSPRINPLTLGLSGALVAALAALAWVLSHQPAAVAAPKVAAPAAPALYAPTPPTPAAFPAAASAEPPRAPPPHHAGVKPSVHHWARPKTAPTPSVASPLATPSAPASRAVSTPTPTDSKGAASSPP